MDTADIIVGLLVVLAGAGIVYYLLQHRTLPVPHARRAEVRREADGNLKSSGIFHASSR
jgi:protein-S-isoprenylcysteine O-methyltransferase Ste14